MAPGDIAFKSNFATFDAASGIVLRRRADRRFEDLGPLLCAALDGLRLPSFPQVGRAGGGGQRQGSAPFAWRRARPSAQCLHPAAPPAPALQHAVSVKYATEHRCGVVVRGPGLSDQISGTDPLKDNLPLQVGARRGQAGRPT